MSEAVEIDYLCRMIENPENIEEILKKLDIEALNEMQEISLTAIKEENDIVLLAPTGSGKTLAFLLPLTQLIDKNLPGVQALVMAPSRELCLQIEQVFKAMNTGCKVTCCYGGHSGKTEKNNLLDPPALIIGTPGRLADHLRRERIDITTIKTLVLDEFDKSLEMGFREEMSFIIIQLKNLTRRILTSATPALEIPSFTGITRVREINYLKEETPNGLEIKIVQSIGKDKFDALLHLLCFIGNHRTIVFCNHRDAVERISNLLQDNLVESDIYHGGLEQEDREMALIKFRNGTTQFLIATDLASRGLDIPETDFIIHYQLALTETAFVHRNGRTARMNAKGTTYLILSQEETLPPYIKDRPQIEKLPTEMQIPEQPDWQTLYIGAGKKDKVNKVDIVGLLLQKGKLQKADLGLIHVLDHMSFVAVKRSMIEDVVRLVRYETIKRKKVKIALAK
jgi:superfamily II DNA/RNA helicase